MSETLVTARPTLLIDPFPVLPETRPIDPIVQCGVLYLGTAPTNAGFRGLDSIQEPFSHRYPVDGTNTLRGIDAVLSVYDNGIQLAFTRQPHAVVFFPISSLTYCASVRFTIIDNGQTKPQSVVDWRFIPLDTIINHENKHPPLFCAVTQRTQIFPGDECHCFITKSTDAAIALIETISKIYSHLRSGIKCIKSPIFYQLDHFGRKLSEITGVIYMSPANDDDMQLNQTNSNRLTDESIRNYLLDPAYDGFFYRTDASLIEQWQLWDDDDVIGSRPHPPASPFGLHEGLYHDDTTHEVQRYLRQMENEDQSCSCTSYSSSKSLSSITTTTSTASSSVSTEYSRQQNRRDSNDKKSIDDSDQFNISLSNLQTSSFEPVLTPSTLETKKSRRKPIIIEKVLPKPVLSIPILNPKLPELPLEIPKSVEEKNRNYTPTSDFPSFSYRINKHGDKITKEGNRIVFMDVVQMNTNTNQLEPPTYIPSIPRPRSHRQRSSKRIPVLDLRSIERLFNEKKISKNHRHINKDIIDNKSKDQSIHTTHSTTPDKLDTTIEYFEEYPSSQSKLNDQAIQTELSSIKTQQQQSRKGSIISSTNSSQSETRHRYNQSTFITGPTINYVEHPIIPSVTPSQTSSNTNQTISMAPVFTNEKLNEYLSNIYGTAHSIKSSSTSTSHRDIKSLDDIPAENENYISAFQYMQSSMSRNIFQEYRDAY